MLYRFRGFSFDTERHELLRPDGARIPLTGKPAEVLLVLLARPGVTVPRDALVERVWPGVVTTEASLRRAVYLLRQALAVAGADPVLATVRGRGYRLDAEVEEGPPPDAAPVEAPLPSGAALPAPRRGRRLALAVGGSVLGLLLFLGRPIPVEAPAPWSEGAPLAHPPSSVAVLRFADLSEGGDHAHLAEGLAQEIIQRLAQVPTLQVIGRTSSFAIAPDASVGEVGDRLGVGSVVRGRVRDSGSGLGIAAELVEVAGERPVLSLEFEIDESDAFQAQQEIAGRVASALAKGVDGISTVRLRPRRTPDPRAYAHFLRGSTTQHYRNREGAIRTVAHFEEAVSLDPEFAEAWAELSRALARFAFHVRDDPVRYQELLRRADEAAYRALELDPSSGLAYAAVAGVANRHGDPSAAVDWLERAIELAPGYPVLLEHYGTNLVRAGRLEEARTQLTKLVERDPLSPLAHRQLGRIHLYLGEPELAVRSLLRCLELNPQDEDAPRLLADAYAAQGRELEAGEVLIRSYAWPLRGPARAGLRLFGTRRMARIVYEVFRWQAGERCLKLPYEAAGMLAVAGDREAMFECLERAPLSMLTYFDREPVFAPYRSDPRFVRLMERAGRRPAAQPIGRVGG